MTILEKAASGESWREFLEYKRERQHLDARQERELCSFIERGGYLPLCRSWTRSEERRVGKECRL